MPRVRRLASRRYYPGTKFDDATGGIISGLMGEDEELLARRAAAGKRRARLTWVGMALVGLMLLGGLATLLVPIVESMQKAAHESMLTKLPYPPVSSPPEGFALHSESFMGGTRVWTAYMPLQSGTSPSIGSDRWVQTSQWFDGAIRQGPQEYVRLEILIHPMAPAPPATRILRLAADGNTTDHVASDSGIVPPGTFPGNDPYEEVSFKVPTETFIALVNAQAPSLEVDGAPCIVTAEDIQTLRAFAAYLRPGATAPVTKGP
jgi:hypothetical protein